MRVGPAASMAERSAPCGVRVLHPQSNPSTMDLRTVVGMAASVLDLCRISDVSSTDAVTELAAVSRLDGDRLVTAVRTATGGRLQLVGWRGGGRPRGPPPPPGPGPPPRRGPPP